MRREVSWQSGIGKSAFHQTVNIAGGDGVLRQVASATNGRPEKRRRLVSDVEASGGEVFDNELLQVVTDGNLARLASLLGEAKTGLVGGVIEVASSKFGDGSDAGGGVDQHGENCTVAQADDVGRVETGQQAASGLNTDFRGLPFNDLMPLGSDGRGRVEDDCVSHHQKIEQPPNTTSW